MLLNADIINSTDLAYACTKGHTDVVKLLFGQAETKGIKLNVIKHFTHSIFLLLVIKDTLILSKCIRSIWYQKHINVTIPELPDRFLKSRLDLNVKTDEGWTPFMLALVTFTCVFICSWINLRWTMTKDPWYWIEC